MLVLRHQETSIRCYCAIHKLIVIRIFCDKIETIECLYLLSIGVVYYGINYIDSYFCICQTAEYFFVLFKDFRGYT